MLTQTDHYVGFVVFSTSGLPIYEMMLKEQLKDATLLTGLLTALQALTVEITETKLEELELQQFQIFLLSSSKFSITYGLISLGKVNRKHALSVIKELRNTYEAMCDKEIRAALELGSIKRVEAFDSKCRKILQDANNYLNQLIKVRETFFDNNKQSDEEIDRLKKDFF